MVFEKIRKGLRPEPPVVAQLRAHQWKDDAQKRDLVERFRATSGLELEEVVWTAVDPTPEIRAAGLEILKRRAGDREVLNALLPLCRTRSEAARRAVERFLKEVAGPELGSFLASIAERGDDFAKLVALEMARELPLERSIPIYRQVLDNPGSQLRSRALKAVAELQGQGVAAEAAGLALPLLSDEDDDIRIGALSVLERNPKEEYVPAVLGMARSPSRRVVDAAFSALRKLVAASKGDYRDEVLPLLGDGNPRVRSGAVSLLKGIPPREVARLFVTAFRGSFPWIRDRALETISKEMPDFVPGLLAFAHESQGDVAKDAFDLSLLLMDPRAVPTWIKLVDDADWRVRSRAIENLGRFGTGREEVLKVLVDALRDPYKMLAVAPALGDLGDPRAAGPLFEAFKASHERPADQLDILDALAALGVKEPRVAPVLESIARHHAVGLEVREKARRLVGKLQGDAAREAIPFPRLEAKRLDLSSGGPVRLVDLLADTVARGASDFHLATGFVPHRRMHGVLEKVDVPPVTAEQAEALIREVLTEEERALLAERKNLDVCVKVPGLGRFRANFFTQRQGLDAVFRAIPQEIPRLETLGLPESAWEVCRYTQGLVLVTGPSGCGKSTTLAALVDRVNETHPGHIITVEDPIEFVHRNKESLVNQRQVPHHTASFARALKSALREDPDVIMVGEMRDLETISLAITASETGHLVFATLSTTTATATVDRIINSFPPGQQGQIRMMVSESLKAVISQALLPRADGDGRVAAFEILRGTQAVGALIRESKTFQLPGILQTGAGAGMNTMDQFLLKLAEEGKVSPEVAMDRAAKKEPFEKLLSEERAAFA